MQCKRQREATNHQKVDVRLCWTTSVFFTHSLRGREPFLLHVWHEAHWYSQHGQRINTRDHSHSQAGVVFSDRRGFTAAKTSTVFLTSLHKDEFAPCGLLCHPIQSKPFIWSEATAGSGSWVIQQGTAQHWPLSQKQQGEIHLQCCSKYHKILLETVQVFANSACTFFLCYFLNHISCYEHLILTWLCLLWSLMKAVYVVPTAVTKRQYLTREWEWYWAATT